MEYIQAVILGIIQGLTEFLPISSSGHLMLIPALTKWTYFGKYFDVALHLGTFISLIIYYRTEVVQLLTNLKDGLLNWSKIKTDEKLKLPWLILLTVIPGGLAGVFFEEAIEKILSSPAIAACCLIIFGILLCSAETHSANLQTEDRPSSSKVSVKEALIIGTAQAIALIPGVSRSGITMTASMFLGMKKEQAANFSFLISMPIIGGAALYSAVKMFLKSPEAISSMPLFLTGIIAASVSGYFVIRFLLNFIKTDSFKIFMYYRIVLGLIILGMFFTGNLK